MRNIIALTDIICPEQTSMMDGLTIMYDGHQKTLCKSINCPLQVRRFDSHVYDESVGMRSSPAFIEAANHKIASSYILYHSVEL
jgi:hypothetical protein